MAKRVVVVGTVSIVMALFGVACPCGRPSADPDKACETIARQLASCSLAPADRWGASSVAACKATLGGTGLPEDEVRFFAGNLQRCAARPCPEVASCARDNLASVRSIGSATGAPPSAPAPAASSR